MRPGPDLDTAKARLETALMIETGIARARPVLALAPPGLDLAAKVDFLRQRAAFSIPEAIEAIQFIERADDHA